MKSALQKEAKALHEMASLISENKL